MVDKLVNVELTRAEFLSPEEREKLGLKVAKGMVAIETTICRDTSLKEVEEIVELYNKDKELAVEKYEQRIHETMKKAKELRR